MDDVALRVVDSMRVVASKPERAGLGLDATRHVLDSLGGSLRVSARGPLGGARVRLHVQFYSLDGTREATA